MSTPAADRRLWLLRHGETVGQSSVRYYGRTDVALSDEGRAQVRALVGVLAGERFRAVVHSPLIRARESAEIVCGFLRARPDAVEPEPDLREVDFGELEGKTAAEIESSQPDFFSSWRSGRLRGYPGGETVAGFAARVARGLDRVLQRHPDGTVCLCVHRGVVKAALAHLLELPFDRLRAWPLDLGSATSLIRGPLGDWHLERYNLGGSGLAVD